MQRRLILLTAAAAALSATAAPAATRNFSVTSFDRIRVEGPFDVTLRTGIGSSARADGPDARMLDRVRIELTGRTLIIRRDQNGAPGGSLQGVRITLTAPAIVGATLLGTGTLALDKASGARFDAILSGAGTLSVDRVDTDLLTLVIAGTGTTRLAGRTRTLRANVQGAGTITAPSLTAQDTTLASAGTANITLATTRAARIDASGSGTITISGTPACTVRSAGTVEIRCGR